MIMVTQEEKEALNSAGISVIEYKRAMYKMSEQVAKAVDNLNDFVNAFIDGMYSLVQGLETLADGIITAVCEFRIYLRAHPFARRFFEYYYLPKSNGQERDKPWMKQKRIHYARNNC